MFNLRKNLKSRSGQAMLEYIILSATVGVFCLVTMKQMGEHLKKRVESINKKIGKSKQSLGDNLLEDNSGRIWNDNTLIDPTTWKSYQLSKADGWDVGTMWARSFAKTFDGVLLFGGVGGIQMIKPHEIVRLSCTLHQAAHFL